jgi:hypothetical protein
MGNAPSANGVAMWRVTMYCWPPSSRRIWQHLKPGLLLAELGQEQEEAINLLEMKLSRL